MPIELLKKSITSVMHHRKTYMYINFQQNRVSKSVIIVHTNVFAKKNRKLFKYATTNSNFFKLTLSDMYHRKTYMNIYFQLNWVSIKQTKPCTQIYLQKIAINCKLHKFAAAIKISEIMPFGHALSPNIHSTRF